MQKRLQNSCQRGFSEPIWEKDLITESYCRCPDGTYGISCTENFANPCLSGQIYHPADSSIPPNYFIECSQMIPYLLKCPAYTEWNQNVLTCDWPRGGYRTGSGRAQASSGYGQTNVAIQQAPISTVASSGYG